jgi:outer membrane cobalamin receptor
MDMDLLTQIIQKSKRYAGALAIAFYLPLVVAEDKVTLPAVIVKAPPESLSQAASNTELLDEEDLTQMHQRSISDVLQGSASYSFSRAGGIGNQGVTLMRGAGGQGIMTLDDIPLLQTIPGSHVTDTLPSEAIQRAEIQRGPSESYYPFQALGGSIRLYTHDQNTSGGKVSVEGGSFGLLRETLLAGLAGKLGRATVTLTRADAFDGTHSANAFNNPERDPFRYTQGILRLSSDLSSTARWEGSMLYRKSTAGIDKFGLNNLGLVVNQDDANSFRWEESWLTQNKLTTQLTDTWESQLQLGYTQSKISVKSGLSQNAVFSRLYLVNWRNRHQLLEKPEEKYRWQLYWGGQGRYEQGVSPLIGLSRHRTSAAGFAGTEFQYQTITGEAGVRVEQFDRFGAHPLFQANASWRIRPYLTLRASGGTGYRLPAYTELLFLFFGNLALKPERAASGEIGFEWHPISNLQFAANGFYHHYQDLISVAYNPKLDLTPPSQNNAYDPHPGSGAIIANVANARVAGMEITGQYNWSNGLDTGFSYTFSDSLNLNTNKLLPLRPRHSAKFWQEWRMPQWPLTLRVETVYRNRTWNDFNNQFPVKDSVQINASLRYRIDQNIEAYLRGENLSDNRHAFVYSFDTPGAAVYGGFNVGF